MTPFAAKIIIGAPWNPPRRGLRHHVSYCTWGPGIPENSQWPWAPAPSSTSSREAALTAAKIQQVLNRWLWSIAWLLGHRPEAENTYLLSIFPAKGMKTRLTGKLCPQRQKKEDVRTLKSVGEFRGCWELKKKNIKLLLHKKRHPNIAMLKSQKQKRLKKTNRDILWCWKCQFSQKI